MRTLRLLLRIVGTNLRSRMEYRYSFLMSYVVQVFSRTFEFLTIWVMLDRFRQIRGWEYWEVMLLYVLNLISFGLAGVINPPMRRLDRLIQQGDFDGLLTCPLNPLLHLVARYYSPVFWGHLLLGAVVLALCLDRLSIALIPLTGAWLALVLFGGALIQASILMIAGTTSFWFVKSQGLIETAIYGVRNFINYPITIYDRWVQVVLTFVVPYAFVSFYPAQSFLRKSEVSLFHPILQYGTPVLGVAMLALAYRFWTVGMNHYQSTGS